MRGPLVHALKAVGGRIDGGVRRLGGGEDGSRPAIKGCGEAPRPAAEGGASVDTSNPAIEGQAKTGQGGGRSRPDVL